MSVTGSLSDAVQRGRPQDVLAAIAEGLSQGLPAQQLLENGLLRGMSLIGVRFKTNDVFVPQVLLAARALNTGLDALKPHLIDVGAPTKALAVIGTVKGDLHDIGKNLVKMMLQGVGIDVIDLGVDVGSEQFVQTVRDHKPDLLCLSALLTTTMNQFGVVIEALKAAGLRERLKIVVGGAPVTAQWASRIGADGYAPDAVSAADLALDVLGIRATHASPIGDGEP